MERVEVRGRRVVDPRHAGDLRRRREALNLGTRQLAAAVTAGSLKVSHTLVCSWERAGLVPPKYAGAVDDALAAEEKRQQQQARRLVAAVRAAGVDGLSEAEALRAVEGLTRSELERCTAAGGPLTRGEALQRDGLGRGVRRSVLRLAGQASASTPTSIGVDELRGLELLAGWDRRRFAEELAVTPVAVAQWERADRVPPVRATQLLDVLDGLPTGALLAAARERLGIGQAELARRLGEGPPTVSAWENGRPGRRAGVPRGKLLPIARALDSYRREPAAAAPVDQAWGELRPLLEQAGEQGLGEVELLHRAQSGRRGLASLPKQVRLDALTRAEQTGELERVDVPVPTRGQGTRLVERYRLPGLTPAPVVAPLEPEELVRRLQANGWTRAQLADALSVSRPAVTIWCQRQPVRGERAARIRELLPADTAAPLVEADPAKRLHEALTAGGAMPREELFRRAGYSRDSGPARAALERLLDDRHAHWRTDTHPDSGQRRRRVAPGPPPLTGEQLRTLRRRLDLTQLDLAAELGISGPAISLYENGGDRPIPARHVEQLRRLEYLPA